MKKLFYAIMAVASALACEAQTNALGSDVPLPPALQAQLPAGAPAFNAAGMSFTNVNYKAAMGTQIESGTGGTLTYFQGDINLFTVKGVGIGLGTELTMSAVNSGFHSAAGDLELVKNFTNWQLVGKGGYGRIFDDSVGNYANFGFDVNYNLAAGTGLAFLGSGSGSYFTYVGSGVSWSDMNFSLTAKQSDINKAWRIYAGIAF